MALRRTLLFIIQPSIGHIVPALCMATTLKENNYNVIFCGNETMESVVVKHGIKYVTLNTLSFALGFERYYKMDASHGYLDNLYLRASNKLFNERKIELEKILDKIKPQAIIIDQFLSSDYIVIRFFNQKVKVFFLQTMMPTMKSENHPPLYSQFIVRNRIDRYSVCLLWLYRSLGFNFWRLLNWVRYFGYDDFSILLNQIKKQNLDVRHERYFLFNYVFQEVPELIMSPLEFEFELVKKRNYHFYVGSLLYSRNRINPNITIYDECFYTRIALERLTRKIIFCSLGTRSNEFSSDASNLFNILKHISERNNYFILVAAGDLFFKFDKLNSDQILFVDRIDQFKMLSMTDLFITHGGLNSIKEAIESCTPMIVLPVDMRSDQPGNAARVSYHTLGVKANIGALNLKNMTFLIQKVLNDNSFKDCICKFKSAIQKYSKEEFLITMEKLIMF